jgi:hypothetical protein
VVGIQSSFYFNTNTWHRKINSDINWVCVVQREWERGSQPGLVDSIAVQPPLVPSASTLLPVYDIRPEFSLDILKLLWSVWGIARPLR